ncbi:MAG: ABC transporter permease [Pseudomonadota bacterium]|nr:ABC transporter permease [Pseudomonadota bacterium]
MKSVPMPAILSFSSAVSSLFAHPLRSALTVLGVVVGVAAVVAVMAVGEGARERIIAQIQSLGGNLLLVTPGSARSQGVRLGSGSGENLTESDAGAIAREVPGVLYAAPSIFRRAQVVRGNANWSTTVQGITNDYLLAREWRLSAGRPFSSVDQVRGAKVALLGRAPVERLFPDQDPIGGLVRVGGAPFRVIGVLDAKGQSSSGADQDDKVMIPLAAARIRVFGSSSARMGMVQYVMVKVDRAERLAAAAGDITRLLRQRHGLAAEDEDDFSVSNLADVQASRQAASGVLTFWLSAVASVSLVVGGISIMNIMLVSLSERTREIGLRLAVGARPLDIRNQFLAEAVLLSLVGALLGLAGGVAVAWVLGTAQGLPILIRPWSLAVAAGFALVTGVFFGFYPAVKASRLMPAEALRVE